MPASVVTLGKLPVGDDGGVDHESLRSSGVAGTGSAPTTPSGTALERLLVSFWSELFDNRPIAVDADFFDLGGHSLLAVALLARIKEILGVDVPVSRLFTASTPAAMAEYVAAQLGPQEAARLAEAVEQVLAMSEGEVQERLDATR
jgi:hypothetical protein